MLINAHSRASIKKKHINVYRCRYRDKFASNSRYGRMSQCVTQCRPSLFYNNVKPDFLSKIIFAIMLQEMSTIIVFVVKPD